MTTWEAAVNGFGAVGSGELGKIRKALDAVYPRPPRRGKGNPRRDTWHQRKGEASLLGLARGAWFLAHQADSVKQTPVTVCRVSRFRSAC